MKPLYVVIAVVAVGLVGAVALAQTGTLNVGGSRTSSEAMDTTPATTDEAMMEKTDETLVQDDSVMTESESVKTFELEAGSFYYQPNTITVKKGDTVKIVMNSVSMMHDFNIDKLGVSIPVTKAGESATVEFVADQVGEFEYYCSVGSHRAQGQVGTLIVTE